LRILYHDIETVDCTADPHPVIYPALQKACEDIIKVLESPLIFAVRIVRLDHADGKVDSKSDRYGLYAHNNKKAQGPEAQQHKIEGLYFEEDPMETVERPNLDANKNPRKFFVSDDGRVCERVHYPPERHLPPGLTGARKAIKRILESPKKYKHLSIGIVWRAFMQHSCSDYITMDIDGIGGTTVDFSNQDDYIGEAGYHEHIEALRKLLGVFGNQVEPYK